MARGALHWTVRDLVRRTGLSNTTVTAFENKHWPTSDKTLARLLKTFSDAGVEFIDGGVRLMQKAS